MGGYAFGDSAPAARPLGLAVDLGCGTGHTTRLLASVLRPRRALGLDQSASFAALAAADAPAGVEFAVHDVTRATPSCPHRRRAAAMFAQNLAMRQSAQIVTSSGAGRRRSSGRPR